MSQLKITLFGATGKTGRYLIAEALQRGMEVTVFARPSNTFENPNVRIIRGDLTDRTLLEEAIRGADAVLSALGPTKLSHPKDLPITRATDAIISTMEQVGVKRLLAFDRYGGGP
jgi:putative NADH-flavin reductase